MTSVMAQHRNVIKMPVVEKETIHSGHFMVSQFEADAQDDEYEVAVPVPEVCSKNLEIIPFRPVVLEKANGDRRSVNCSTKVMSVSIETSLTKLFQCMSIAYRQKLTSPKWNRFKGVRLRWKEKIRLNNVIWRCWHMQFVMKRNIGVCQFASPLDVDIHSKPEAVVLEGKYWKRKLSAVTAEYKRWRLFYQKLAYSPAREQETLNGPSEWNLSSLNSDSAMMVDEDYWNLMSDTLFSTITSSQPFAFPNTREIARGANLADFIQPSLVQLQPNLDDYMDMLEPLQDLLSPSSKLPSVPEEYHPNEDLCRSLNVNYEDMSSSTFYPQGTSTSNMETSTAGISSANKNLQHQQQFYVKCEQEHASQNMCSEMGFRGGSVYHETAANYQNHNNANSYSTYQVQNYNQQSNHSSLNTSAVNYSSQANVKNASSSPMPINYNNTSMVGGLHYGAYESNLAYSAPNSNMMSYSPTSSSNYKIIPSRPTRSGSLTTNPGEEDLLTVFAVPKLSQRGRSRSGSSLVSNHNKYVSSDQSNDPTNNTLIAQLLMNNRQYNHPASYQSPNSVVTYGCSLSSDGRICYNGHRQVAHCTALLGRRSRTPDHILSSNSNPVGYCKPRTPLLPSQNGEGLLINLSSDRSTEPCTGGTSHNHGYSYSRRASQCSKSPYDKCQNSPVHPPTWSSGGGYSPSYAGTSSTSNAPFIFTATNSSASSSDVPSNVSQLMNNASTSNSPKHPSSPSTSESLSLSPLTVSSPIRGTPSSPTTRAISSTPYREHRRVNHINAEHKRRCNIKNGFDTLHMLIPHLVQNPNTKMSKAAMLQKGAEYIRQLRAERSQLREEIESLKQQVDSLNSAISNCQSLLPVTGAPVSKHKTDKIIEIYDNYVKERTKKNWKFWILSLICEPLLASFNSSVSTSSYEELCRTTIQWAEHHCSLVDLRPIVLNALRHVCTTTDVLSNPTLLPDEAKAAVFDSTRKN